MKQTISLFIVAIFMFGCSNQPPLNPNDPSSYKENKMLIQYLEKEGFNINIPASEAINKYSFNNIYSLRGILQGSDRNSGLSNYRTPEQTAQKVWKADCALYNRRVIDYYDYPPTNTGFSRGTLKNGILKHLEKCLGIGGLVGHDNLMKIQDEFVAKYGTDGLVLKYDNQIKDYIYYHPPTYYIKYHNRCVTFIFSAHIMDIGNLKKTILIGKLKDDDLVEKIKDHQDDINRKSKEARDLERSF